MTEAILRPMAYHVVRYTPNLVRDEWINIGVLLFDPASGRVLRRLIDEPAELARVRRMHPGADEALLRRLPEEFEAQFAGNGATNGAPNNVANETPTETKDGEQAGATDGAHKTNTAQKTLTRLEQTLSNAVQLSPQKGVLTADLEAELDRLYRDHVEPPRYARAFEDLASRNAIRTRANQTFRTAGIWPRLGRHLRVEEFTFPGDPLRIDYSYRRNGTRGFVQALPLGRDPGQAKVLAFTAEAIRSKLPKSEFIAVSEVAPRPDGNARHQFVVGLLEQRDIAVVPLTRLAEWARQIAPGLHAANGG